MGVLFEQFTAIDQKSSSTDLDKRVAQEITNLSTTKKPGALVKDGTYTDISTSLVGADLPSSRTRKSLFQFGLTHPSNTDIYLAHVKSGSDHEIYVGKNWDGSSAFNSTWLELSEAEGAYTTDATTTASSVKSDEPTGTTTDYYKGWWVIVTIGGVLRPAIVTASSLSGSDTTLTVTTGALNGIASSGEAFSLFRYNISSGIASATIDDVIRWKAFENSAIGMMGNTSSFPTQFNLWYGYVDRTVGTTNAETLTDFYLDVQAPLRPDTSKTAVSNQIGIVQTLSSSNTANGELLNASGTEAWAVNVAYVYDGFQIGPLGAWQTVTFSSGHDTITLGLTIPFLAQFYSADSNFINAYEDNIVVKTTTEPFWPGTPGSYKHQLLSKRVTGVRIYTRDTSQTNTIAFNSEKTIASSATGEIDFVMSSEKILTLTITITTHSGNTHLQDIGQSNLAPNYKYGTSVSSHFLAAAIRTINGDRKNNNLIASIVDGAGVATQDNFGGSNVINLGFFGSKEITGVHVLGDEGIDRSPKARALVFTDDDYYIFNIVSGTSFTHTLDSIGSKEGLVAPDSLVYAEGNLFGVSRNGFRIFTVNGTKIIGEGLKPDFDTFTTVTDAIGGYFKKDRIVIFHFPTHSKTYAVDLLSENFGMFELNWNDTIDWFTPQRSGELIAMDSDKFFQIGSGTTQDSTTITPTLKTKRFTALDMGIGDPGDEVFFTEGFIKYKSNSAITFNFYLNNSSTAITFNNLTLPSHTTETEEWFKFPKGTRGYEAEAEVTLSSGQKSSNTSLEINKIFIDGYKKRRWS